MINLSKYRRKEVPDYAPNSPSFLLPQYRWEDSQPKLSARQAEWIVANYSDCTDTDLAMTLWCDIATIRRYAHNHSLQKSPKFAEWAKRHDPTKPVPPPHTHLETDEELLCRIERESQEDYTFATSLATTFDFCNSQEKRRIAVALLKALRWGREHC